MFSDLEFIPFFLLSAISRLSVVLFFDFCKRLGEIGHEVAGGLDGVVAQVLEAAA